MPQDGRIGRVAFAINVGSVNFDSAAPPARDVRSAGEGGDGITVDSGRTTHG